MLDQEVECRLDVTDLAKACPRASRERIAPAESDRAGTCDPREQYTSIVDHRVGTHQFEHGNGVVKKVAADPGRGVHGVGADWPGPAVMQVRRQM